MNCTNCDEEITGKGSRYCSNSCQLEYQRVQNIEKWLAGQISGGTTSGVRGWVKQYLIDTRGNKCEQCGWEEINPTTGKVPIEVDHIDDNEDHNIDNLRLLCPNCHSLTSNYRALNKGNGRFYRRVNG
jgi:hypothetical protein